MPAETAFPLSASDTHLPTQPPTESQVEQLLREQSEILEYAGVGIAFIRQRQVKRCNNHYAHIYGFADAAAAIGTFSSSLYANAQDFLDVGENAYPLMQSGKPYKAQLLMQRLDASQFWCRITGTLVNLTEPDAGSIWVIEDVTELYQAELLLQKVMLDQQLILQHAMVGVAFLNDRRVESCNRRFEELFGYEPGELHGASSRSWYLSEADWQAAGERCYEPFTRGLPFHDEMLLGHRNGTPIWCEVRAKAIDANDPGSGSIWITMDITARKEALLALEAAQANLEAQVMARTAELQATVEILHREMAERRQAEQHIRHMAQHDALTGLVNRHLLHERIGLALAAAATNCQQVGLLFIDLDRFKNVNDALGHAEGDALLKAVAQRLLACVTASDTVARIGGDEFVVLVDDIADGQRLGAVASQIHRELERPVALTQREVTVSASIGVSSFPSDGANAAELMAHADVAMYHAKARGRNQTQHFDATLSAAQAQRIDIEQALHIALREQQFELHYQPQIDARSGRIVGAEALIRWHRPGVGMVPPNDFIRIAEEAGLIERIGHWVLAAACQQNRAWQIAGLPPISVSVNVSALQLQGSGFRQQVQAALASSGLAPHYLELELTESAVINPIEHNNTLLHQLHSDGVRLSIDDFGTGYSSLSYLRHLPIHGLKIDRSFVRDISTNANDAVICKMIAAMAQSLNLAVTAEGVETAEQLALLRGWGCEHFQGFFFSRPLPSAVFAQLLAKDASAPS